MNPQRSIEYLTGFFMGLFLGLGLDGVLVVIIRLINGLSQANIQVAWWWLIPCPCFPASSCPKQLRISIWKIISLNI